MSRCRLFIHCLMILLFVSSAHAGTSVRMYAIWQPKVGGEWEAAKSDKPVGGSIKLRIVILPDPQAEVTVESLTITEAKTTVHPTPPVKIETSFSKATPNIEWGDPNRYAAVLESAPIPTFSYHNMPHTLAAGVRIASPGSDVKPAPVPAQSKISFGNLVVVDSNPDPALPWLFETVSLTFSCRLDHAQSGTCTVEYEVFSARDHSKPVATKVFRDVPCPGYHSWRWDGKQAGGGEPYSNLYVYRITAESTDDTHDHDTNRSPYLRVRYALDDNGKPMGETEFMKVDEGGTPEDEGDDVYEYATTFVLIDDLGRAARSGQLILYVPDVNKAASWEMPALECLVHKGKYDGLSASKQGTKHNLLVPVPARLVEYAGDYLYVNRYIDDHADQYKDHKPKPALDWY